MCSWVQHVANAIRTADWDRTEPLPVVPNLGQDFVQALLVPATVAGM